MKDKIYFPNLNGVRFIAAMMVVVCHLELNKHFFKMLNYRSETKQLGVIGVDLFFVLSGFLITYLLLKEKAKFKTINLRSFYYRRILRIWPLYYFVVLLSLFVLPNISFLHFSENNPLSISQIIFSLLLFVLMLPNVLFFIKIPYFSAQTWSIGTEEQFYLIWPFIVSRFKNLFLAFILIFASYWVVYFLIQNPVFDAIKYFNLFRNWFGFFKVDVLSIGAIAAFLLYSNSGILAKIVNNLSFFMSIALLMLLFVFLPNQFLLERTLYALVFGVIILNLVRNERLGMLLENRLLDHFGKISYGIYMYHNIIIVIVLNVMMKYNFMSNVLLYSISIFVTLLVSHLSYLYLEKPFLKIKLKYSPFENTNAPIYRNSR